MKIEVKHPEAVVKRALFLAYQACGRPMGMGVFQARNGATEEAVWQNVLTSGDYSTRFDSPPDEVYADYVFGRMMKVGFKWDADSVTIRDATPRADYQEWCVKYPTYQALVEAAVKALQAEVEA